MMFRKAHGRINVTSPVERVSRYAVVLRDEDRHRQSKPIMEALIGGLAPCPPMPANRSPSTGEPGSPPGNG